MSFLRVSTDGRHMFYQLRRPEIDASGIPITGEFSIFIQLTKGLGGHIGSLHMYDEQRAIAFSHFALRYSMIESRF